MKYSTIGFLSLSLLCLAGCDQPSTKKESMQSHMTTPSGLQYEVLAQGTGTQATAGRKATVHYTGWLQENGQQGKKFDSSVDRNQPFTFNLGAGQVIAGWDEGVALMKVGSKYRFIIPAHLGYGAHGAGGIIPANATLIFDVELLDVK